MKQLSFQQIIFTLQNYWHEQGCAILQPYDIEMGAGTFHPATVFGALGTKPCFAAFVQPSRRPGDSRFAEHPNRMQHYYQFQVILKPSPDNIQELYLQSLQCLGIDIKAQDIRFIEDDWQSPTLGASGLGWEVWCNGMEVSQFTYMQQIGGIQCKPVTGEITYGLERIALYIQEIDNVADLIWCDQYRAGKSLTYGEVDFVAERQFSKFNLEVADIDLLIKHFVEIEEQAEIMIQQNLPLVAYDYCIKTSHLFNLLDARGAISVTERASYIARVRSIVKRCCLLWLEQQKRVM